KPDRAVMEFADGFDERETQAAARCGSTLLQSEEAFEHARPFALGNTRSVIGNNELNAVRHQGHGEADCSARRRVAYPVLDQVGEELGKEASVATHEALVRRVDLQAMSIVLRDAAVDISDLAGERTEIDRFEAR